MKKISVSRILPFLIVFGFYIYNMFWIFYPDTPNQLTWILKGAMFGIAAAWLIWRGLICKIPLPRTGLEKGMLAFTAALLLGLIFTPEPRLAWPVIGSVLRFFLLFCLLLDVSSSALDHSKLLTALLALSGILLALAALETYTVYSGWWNTAGMGVNPPFPYRYKSLTLHSNIMMGYVNLFAPLAFVAFINRRSRGSQLLGGTWLILYALCLPFSSSRGGWLGAVTWIGLLLLYFVVQKGWHKKIMHLSGRSRAALFAGIAVLLAAAAVAGIFFLQTFAAHPSHGSNVFGGRSSIWLVALESFRDHPLFGAGAGRIGLEYLGNAESIPPQFWASHAHSLYIQILSELGLVGFAAFAFLLGVLVTRLWRIFRQANSEDRLPVYAALAGIGSLLVHSVVDVFTNWAPVTDQMLLLLVWIFAFERPLPRAPRLKLNLLWIPLILLAGWCGWNTWSADPMRQAVTAAQKDNWPEAARYTAEAVKRDPDLRYNRDMHAFALAWSDAQTGRTAGLAEAIESLSYVPDTPAAPALWEADLAVLEWQNGEEETAIGHLGQAIERAPLEPTFYLNLAVMQEKRGQTRAALDAYCDAFKLAPAWAGHPFWQTSSTRQQAAEECDIALIGLQPWWRQAQQAILQGDPDAAALHLARSDWADEADMARGITRGLLLEARGETDEAVSAWEKALTLAATPNLEDDDGNFMGFYAGYFNRSAMPVDLVPGYMQLQQDVGQFAVMEKLAEIYRANGDMERLAWVEQLEQMAVHGQVGINSIPE